MFGTFSAIANVPRTVQIDPGDVPPPTPVTFPPGQLSPEPSAPTPRRLEEHLVSYLQSIYRPTEVTAAVFKTVGLNVFSDVRAEELLPDDSFLPDYAAWDSLSADAAAECNDSTRKILNTGILSPGVLTYHDRRRELSISNDDAFHVVRRLPPAKGKPQARLGNAYEFYRCLESLTTFWDDTSKAISATAPIAALGGDEGPSSGHSGGNGSSRTSTGSSMPFEYRQNLIHAFLKLIAYDFGCSAQPARVEPRLQLKAPSARLYATSEPLSTPRCSYFASGCTFIFRSPRTREAARQGLVDGPIAAISARGTTSFETEQACAIDLGREVIAGLVTAQQRYREGKKERRPGEGLWWTTKPRWGGGPGGPIGREIDRDAVQGNEDDRPSAGETANTSSSSLSGQAAQKIIGVPASKRPRKQMSIYDNYRMIRPPSAYWDPKCRYESIGKVHGAGYDDIFVISSLFHHVSLLRVRVPDTLLDVLEGAQDPDASHSGGELEVRRSPWFDLFLIKERVEAMQLVWGMMAWTMRQTEKTCPGDKDVKMTDS